MTYKTPTSEPIAVIGTSCRFAGGVTTPSKLWELLANPIDLSREVPPERFNIAAFYHPDGEYHGTTNSPKAYFLDQDHRVFDASFFNITPKEAEAIDPQQRMLLEVVYEALESAGYTLRQYAGRNVAVYAGLMTADYDMASQRDELDNSQYHATGNARSILSNRISYFFDFHGPSMTVDTACSSSLVALHQAVLSLRSGESSMACVAGANLILAPEQFIVESNLHMLSPSGHCRMWDAAADGYARGEGVAAIFIKPLSQAIADGDRIEAVIRETGVNSDGRSRGITMPNWVAQSALIQDTYQRAGLDPKDPQDRCQYFEAHGTGTSAGDPNEARAIEDAFFGHDENATPSNDKLLVGSVKTVIGHTEGAAGLAGLIKVIVSMRNGSVPPNLHLEKLNPEVEKYYTHLHVPTAIAPWPRAPAGQPKRGSINSFGFGGTNAHAIVEEYLPEVHNAVAKAFFHPHGLIEFPEHAQPADADAGASKAGQICLPLALSAPSQKSLAAVARAYRDHLLRGSVSRAEEVAWHTCARRTAFPFRASVSSLSVAGLIDKLGALIAKADSSPAAAIGTRARPEGEHPKILGVFTGQGAQWATMSRGLLRSSEVFAATIRKLDKILAACPHPPGWSLEQEILAEEGSSRVYKASVSQPLCTAVQLALVDLLRHLGVTFHTVVGHSSGEIAAAYAAGKICLRDAMLISHYRGMRVDTARGAGGAKGGMLAAGLSRKEAEELCASDEFSGGLWVAASNAPSSVTLSGDRDLVDKACDHLAKQQKFARRLFVDVAYHSPHMDGLSVKYHELLRSCNIVPTEGNGTIWVSSVYGAGEPSQEELTARYWRDNMVNPVLFHEALSTALDRFGPFDCAVEVGPHPALKGPVTQTMKDKTGGAIPYSGVLDRKADDREAFAEFLGWMWTQFGSSAWQIRKFVEGSVNPELVSARLADAPLYPWDHSQPFYRESRLARQFHFKPDKPHELLGVRTRDDNKHELRWRNILKLEKLTWVEHHSFQGQALLPASAYMVMTLDAARVALAGRQASIVELRDLRFLSGVVLEPNSPGVEILFSLTIDQETRDTIEASFTFTSAEADGRTDMKKNFSGRLTAVLGEPTAQALPSRPKDQPEALHANPETFYQMMDVTGLMYTGPFRGLQTLERRYNFCSGTLRKYHPEDTTELSISPATLDSCLQTAFLAVSSPGDNAIWTSFLPISIDRVRFNLATCDTNDRQASLAVNTNLTKATPISGQTPASFTADVEVFNPEGAMEIQIEGLTVGSFSPTKPEEDYELYLTTKFDVDPDDEIVVAAEQEHDAPSPVLAESCERVASFYAARAVSASTGQQQPSATASSWPNETEESLDEFIRASPFFPTLDAIRQLGKSLPDALPGVLPTAVEEAHKVSQFQRHVARVVRQIVHKYPRLNILGLTDPELGLTEHVLAGLDGAFLSYRVGSEPEKNIESRVSLPDAVRKKIKVDKVDLGGAAETEHEEAAPSYDMVLLTTSLIEPHKTAAVLRQVQRMMRPGGFLLLVHVSLSPLKDRIRQHAGSAPGENAAASPPDWPDLLDQCGFARSPKNSHQYYLPGFSLIVRQADSAEKDMLLDPLGPLAEAQKTHLVDKLLIVGAKEEDWAAIIASQVHDALVGRCGSVEVVATLEALDLAAVPSFSAVVVLAELDQPVLHDTSHKQMEALRALFKPQMIVVWVTEESRFSNLDHAASFGLLRTLAAETPGLALQIVDIDGVVPAHVISDAVSEAFARLAMHTLADEAAANKPLWINEPEVHIEEGRRLVPRVLPWKEANERVNASRRVVTRAVNTLESVVQVVPGTGTSTVDHDAIRYEVEVQTTAVASLGEPGQPIIQVDYSTAEAVTPYFAHLCVGRDPKTGKTHVAVSRSNASYVAVPPTCQSSIDEAKPPFDKAVFLAVLARYLAVFTIAKHAQGRTVLLFEPDKMLHECVYEILPPRGVEFRVYSTDAARCASTPGMVYFHPLSAMREVKALFPAQHSWVIDMLPKGSKLSGMLARLAPPNCHYSSRPVLVRPAAQPSNPTAAAAAGGNNTAIGDEWKQLIPAALCKAATLTWPSDVEPAVIALPELLQQNDNNNTLVAPFQIVDWRAERSVVQVVKPVVGTRMLRPDRTYVLVGLTRDFGQSLCTLFVEHGARYLVLASRNPPKTKPKWQLDLLSRGVTVRFETLDVTDTTRVLDFRARLAHEMPPVGGVVNGAMVLEDRVFSQMSLATLKRVMAPKTKGSRNLDLAFHDPNLEFFIMTSSFASVGGHAGQANYAAANMFMNALAASRRRRGLVGSVLNIGVIYGLGFLHREKDELYQGLERDGYPPISERDIHHMFLEAIAAGKPVPGQVYDITTGLRRFPAHARTLHWHNDPRFSHFTRAEDDAAGADAAGSGGGSQQQSLRERIDGAQSGDELAGVLVDAVIDRLQTQLQLTEGSVTRDHTFSELGVDSLAAVEIRSWIWKALGQDVAVMKILGGSTIAKLCREIADAMMQGGEKE